MALAWSWLLVLPAALLGVAVLCHLREKLLIGLPRKAMWRWRRASPFGKVLACTLVLQFAYKGVTKLTMATPLRSTPPPVVQPNAGDIDQRLSATNLCFAAIERVANSTALLLAWPVDDRPPLDRVGLFSASELRGAWEHVLDVDVSACVSNALVEVMDADMSPNDFTAARFFRLGDSAPPDADCDGLSDVEEAGEDGAEGDPDHDGVGNSREYAVDIDPRNPDTDGDGFSDGVEISQGYDPADVYDNEACRVTVRFHFGDPSGSASEKYRLELSPVAGAGPGRTPASVSRTNSGFGQCETFEIPLKVGWAYSVKLYWVGSTYGTNPDYDYVLRFPHGWPLPSNVVLDDPQGLFCEDYTSDSFAAEGKEATISVVKADVCVCSPDNDTWVKLDVGRVVLDNEELRLKIRVSPQVRSISDCSRMFGSSSMKLMTSGTLPQGVDVSVEEATLNNSETGITELRFAFTRDRLKSLGLLDDYAPAAFTGYWGKDLDCLIISGCSILDINDYGNNFSYDPEDHAASPGKLWEAVGPAFMLGYNYSALSDAGGAPERIIRAWLAKRVAKGDVNAWMEANAENKAWNACAIVKGNQYIYLKKGFWGRYKVIIVSKENW